MYKPSGFLLYSDPSRQAPNLSPSQAPLPWHLCTLHFCRVTPILIAKVTVPSGVLPPPAFRSIRRVLPVGRLKPFWRCVPRAQGYVGAGGVTAGSLA
ncbi:unnamed protein product [Lampetra fluviatilis]